MLLNIVTKSIKSRRDLYFPMIMAVVITLSLIGAAEVVGDEFNRVIDREMSKYGINVILRLEEGEQATAGVPVQLKTASVNGEQKELAVTPVFSLMEINPAWIILGQSDYVVGQLVADELGIEQGDALTIDGALIQPSILKSGTRFDSYIFSNGTPQNASLALIRTDNPGMYEGRNAIILKEMVQTRYRFLGSIESLMLTIAMISVLASFATVINLARLDAGKRRKELGIFKSLGGSGSRILLLISSEYLILSLVSIIAGVAGTLLLSWAILQYVADYAPVIGLTTIFYISGVTFIAFGFAGLTYMIESHNHNVVHELRGV
ncbi:ABC transporter permease [Fodinibius sediminis]|uniref:FtsX-like permease family protein n=1 Tax=Fodinibius sediminis TaxID=1214077 RepID=A0A521CYI9_9BACT|nr:FtsX-like permease family protein [Fodinibius sediminis]SMO64495.1 FtsX-like permease family protein [Fodinibius sediminis]